MYLGSRQAIAVRWSSRPDLSVPGFGLPDYNAGWPIHHGQSNKVKHHPYATKSGQLLRRAEDIRRFEDATPFLITSANCSLTEYQSWPKSEFELAENEDGDDDEGEEEMIPGLMMKSLCGAESESHSFNVASEVCLSEETVLGHRGSSGDAGYSALSKKGSTEESQSVVQRTISDSGGIGLRGDHDLQVSLTRLSPMEGREFLETELVFNQHVHEMKLALPVRSTQSGRPSKRQTETMSVCRPSACRRRVHPVGKFTDEFVNWMPHSGVTDDEKDDEDNDIRDSENFKHCISKAKKSSCNGSSDVRVEVKRSNSSSSTTKRSCQLSKHRRHHHHHPKRKRSHFAVDRKEGGLHTRRRKQHNPWSIEETRMLIKGVWICGEGHWADIKRLDFNELASRSPVDLKDKWRNLLRLAQMTQTQSRNKKGEKRTDLPADMLQQVRMLGTYQK